jgi:TATA-box binding protein (TBP) (component of TFIID and TFIIIB)
VYANGKVIIVGAKSEDDVRDSMDEFYEEIQEWIDLD